MNNSILQSMAELVRKRIVEETGEYLSKYAENPSVFYQKAPSGADDGWGYDTQYPMIVFYMELFKDAEKGRTGTLSVDVICSSTGTMPEDVEDNVKKSLDRVIFTAPSCNSFIVTWKNTQSFHQAVADANLTLFGITIEFDINDFPKMETSNPDPVATMNDFLKSYDDEIMVIGKSVFPEFFLPTRNKPCVWTSIQDKKIDRQTNSVVWFNATLIVHVFAPTVRDKAEWITSISHDLSLQGEIIMPDGSPMFIWDIRTTTERDELSGQMYFDVQYGQLRKRPFDRDLHHVNFS